jgi:hypothetical protein
MEQNYIKANYIFNIMNYCEFQKRFPHSEAVGFIISISIMTRNYFIATALLP